MKAFAKEKNRTLQAGSLTQSAAQAAADGFKKEPPSTINSLDRQGQGGGGVVVVVGFIGSHLSVLKLHLSVVGLQLHTLQ